MVKMRAIGQWCYITTAMLSFFAFLATAYFYSQSYQWAHGFHLAHGTRDGEREIATRYTLRFENGNLHLVRAERINTLLADLRGRPGPAFTGPNLLHTQSRVVDDELFMPEFDTHWEAHRDHPSIAYRLGFGYNALYFPNGPRDGEDSRHLAMPLWLVLLLLGILPARLLSACVRHLRAPREPHLCPTCAYDLRASIGRCPECGRAITAPVPIPID